ncbi:hypothetical protein Y032_0605g570 [Ancylostoma ceylanicum]|uniref:Uncharacterized protein n=1 Tax=Ancylostoma ceylanicum TaxID=53326 RepID=A0A016WLZ4_9BILA|nr:hypothetical protein Y032_0605g570 [Ancylostoma ceylanicum]
MYQGKDAATQVSGSAPLESPTYAHESHVVLQHVLTHPLRLQQHALVRKCNVDNRLSTEDGRQLHGPIDCCRSRRYGGCDRCSSVAVRR